MIEIPDDYKDNNYPIYHNETIVIDDIGDQYLFNILALSLITIGIISVLCKGCPTIISRINNTREISNVSDYISHREIEEDINISVELCSICIESYMPREKTITLPCNHKFHSNCIKDWLETELTCPMCRKSIEI